MAKKNKIKKLTDEQYLAYIAGLREWTAPVDYKGDLIVPETFVAREEKENTQGD